VGERGRWRWVSGIVGSHGYGRGHGHHGHGRVHNEVSTCSRRSNIFINIKKFGFIYLFYLQEHSLKKKKKKKTPK
jgi:hypothetical protein